MEEELVDRYILTPKGWWDDRRTESKDTGERYIVGQILCVKHNGREFHADVLFESYNDYKISRSWVPKYDIWNMIQPPDYVYDGNCMELCPQ